MKRPTFRYAAVCALAFAAAPCLAQTSEHPQVTSSSQQFLLEATSATKRLADGDFDDMLDGPALGSTDDDHVERLRAAINKATLIPGTDQVDTATEYQVILQPGHYLRRAGATGAQGARVAERELVAYISAVAARQLRERGISVAVVSADTPFRDRASTARFEGLKGKIFLAIHADGNPTPCRTGPSLAYHGNSSMFAMHAIGYALGAALGYSYNDFMKDNLTVNSANYYMFPHVRTSLMTGLLEVGEVTCAESEKRLILGADAIGHNVANALQFVLKAHNGGH